MDFVNAPYETKKRRRHYMKPKVYEFQEKKVIGVGNIGDPIKPGGVWPIKYDWWNISNSY